MHARDPMFGTETFWVSEARSKKTLAHLADLDPDGLCQGPPQDEENGVRETQT